MALSNTPPGHQDMQPSLDYPFLYEDQPSIKGKAELSKDFTLQTAKDRVLQRVALQHPKLFEHLGFRFLQRSSSSKEE